MAFSVKITGYSETLGQVLMEMKPQWWDAEELTWDNRFIESSEGGVYYDCHADLSLKEIKELHERYKGNVTTTDKWLCFTIKQLSPPCQQLHEALFDRSKKYSHFHVNVFEWESGL